MIEKLNYLEMMEVKGGSNTIVYLCKRKLCKRKACKSEVVKAATLSAD